jgi:hypothetical protein
MRTEFMQMIATVLWMLVVTPLGYAAGVTSHPGWIALVLLALTPAIIMIRFWGVPARIPATIRHEMRRSDEGRGRSGS